MTQAQLYRHYDADGALLYVGISASSVGRLVSHRAKSRWFDLVTRVDIERFTTRAEALRAERSAIANERPIFNVRHKPTYGGELIHIPPESSDGFRFFVTESGDLMMLEPPRRDWSALSARALAWFNAWKDTEAGRCFLGANLAKWQ
jgi:predicted GIY-YIG superfamily endonuclease